MLRFLINVFHNYATEVKNAGAGITLGSLTTLVSGSLLMGVLVAFTTGAATICGQLFVKWIERRFKNK